MNRQYNNYLNRLQELINSLEELKAEEDQTREELNATTNTQTETNSVSENITTNNFINGNE